tara:strand:- start:474 stop:1313 length:840 start_codon:yes stop_codon:yes gene_type:complete
MIISENIIEILTKYLLTINNFNKFFFTNITLYKNNKLLENLYIKGIILINNIFNISLLYLDSLVDIYNLCEKGYIYFIEFINQINITNSSENNSFELTLKDAIIFSYKKTIFNIETTVSTDISEFNNFKHNIINEIIIIINNLSFILNKNTYKHFNSDTNINEFINSSTLSLSKFIKKIFNSLDINTKISTIDYKIVHKLKNINSTLLYINNDCYNNDTLYDDEVTKNILHFIEKFINKKLFTKNFDNIFLSNNIFIDSFNYNDNINNLLTSFNKLHFI